MTLEASSRSQSVARVLYDYSLLLSVLSFLVLGINSMLT